MVSVPGIVCGTAAATKTAVALKSDEVKKHHPVKTAAKVAVGVGVTAAALAIGAKKGVFNAAILNDKTPEFVQVALKKLDIAGDVIAKKTEGIVSSAQKNIQNLSKGHPAVSNVTDRLGALKENAVKLAGEAGGKIQTTFHNVVDAVSSKIAK